ncbi:polysaccharide deacetylase family protein [Streptomyces sannanensis]|uniref:Polysaccharide deacetylase family protein n=2 Tax=Streptomyces sannanensis TaxID=285536 RepID=A0ABP6S473_9ACTN
MLRAVGCLGAGAVLRLMTLEGDGTPASRPVQPSSAPVAGAPAGRPPSAAAYRLQPMTSYAPERYRPPLPPVRTRPILAMPELGRAMVLTFDDGPDPRYTPEILRILREHEVRAMFLVCGGRATEHPDLLREMADDGHVVGNHSWSHARIYQLPRPAVRDELGRTSEAIERMVGVPPQWYRAPYGAWNRISFEVGAELGMEPLGWNLDSSDWRDPGVPTILGRVRAGASPGAVVLQHDYGGARWQSVTALRTYLPELLTEGYRITVPPVRR